MATTVPVPFELVNVVVDCLGRGCDKTKVSSANIASAFLRRGVFCAGEPVLEEGVLFGVANLIIFLVGVVEEDNDGFHLDGVVVEECCMLRVNLGGVIEECNFILVCGLGLVRLMEGEFEEDDDRERVGVLLDMDTTRVDLGAGGTGVAFGERAMILIVVLLEDVLGLDEVDMVQVVPGFTEDP